MYDNIVHSKSSEFLLIKDKNYHVLVDTYKCDEDPGNINFIYEVLPILEKKPKENPQFWGDAEYIYGKSEAGGHGSYIPDTDAFCVAQDSTFPAYYMNENEWGETISDFIQSLYEEVSIMESDLE